MQKIVLRKSKFFDKTNNIKLFKGEKNADYLQILIPTIYNNIELTECNVRLTYITPDNNEHSFLIDEYKQDGFYKDTYISYLINIEERFTSLVGEISLYITITDSNENVVLKSDTTYLTIDEHPKGENGITPEEIEIIDQVVLISNEAKQNSLEALENSEDAKQIAQSVRDDADNGVFDGADGYTPIKGTDYFTEQEIEEIEQGAAEKVDLSDLVPNTRKIGDESLNSDITKDKLGREVTKAFVAGGSWYGMLIPWLISQCGSKYQETENTNDISALESYVSMLNLSAGNKLALAIDTTNYELSISLLNQGGTVLDTKTVDFPLESVVVSGEYDDTTKEVVLTLQNGSEIRFSVSDLVDGLVSETMLESELSDYVQKEQGKGLSTNDYTTAEKNKLAGLENYNDTEIRGLISDKSSIFINTAKDYVSQNPQDYQGVKFGDIIIWAQNLSTAQTPYYLVKNIYVVIQITQFFIGIVPLIPVDGSLNDSSTNPVQNKTIKTALNRKADKTEIPDVSEFITNSVNDLLNYYLKTETYTKGEVNSLISSISRVSFEVVSELPQTGEANVIYLVPSSNSQTANVKDEYIWLNGAWEQIGSTAVDLTGYATETWVSSQISDFLTAQQISALITTALASYYTKTEMNSLLADKVDKISGKQLSTNDYTTVEKTKLAGLSNYDDSEIREDIADIQDELSLKIIEQPSNVIAIIGSNVTIPVVAMGDNLSYQWQISTNKGVTWNNSSSASANNRVFSFTMSANYDGRLFRCVVTDSNNNSVISNPAQVRIEDGVKITKHPSDVLISPGVNFIISVEATGNNLLYQWEMSVDNGQNWTNSTATGSDTQSINLSVSDTYSTSVGTWDGRLYRCKITDGYGNIVYSNPAQVIPGNIVRNNQFPSNSSSVGGCVRYANGIYGIKNISNGVPGIIKPTDAEIEAQTDGWKVLTPLHISKVVKAGVTNNSIQLTNQEKEYARDWIGADGGNWEKLLEKTLSADSPTALDFSDVNFGDGYKKIKILIQGTMSTNNANLYFYRNESSSSYVVFGNAGKSANSVYEFDIEETPFLMNNGTLRNVSIKLDRYACTSTNEFTNGGKVGLATESVTDLSEVKISTSNANFIEGTKVVVYGIK